MKIAISIPDNVFRGVKKAAEEQKRSRSEIIAEAVRDYLKKLESRRIFDSLNEVLCLAGNGRGKGRPETGARAL